MGGSRYHINDNRNRWEQYMNSRMESVRSAQKNVMELRQGDLEYRHIRTQSKGIIEYSI